MESRQVPHPQLSAGPSYVGCALSLHPDVMSLLSFGCRAVGLSPSSAVLVQPHASPFGIELFVPFTLGSYSKF